jgi:apolipoprotein N-acyltransferase
VDRYGNPVTLTYNKQKTHATAVGGLMTILTTLFLVYWIAVSFLQYVPSPTYNAKPLKYDVH